MTYIFIYFCIDNLFESRYPYNMKNNLKNRLDSDSHSVVEVIDELPLWSAPFGLKLLDNIVLKKNITVLDIGSGTGFPLTEIAMRLGSTCKIIGIDPWHEAIERIKKKLEVYGINNVEIIEGVAENIPLGDDSIDLITSNNGINNVLEPEIALKECFRVLKSGGQFIQTMNLKETMNEFYDIFRAILSDNGMKQELNSLENHIYHKRKPIEEFTLQLADIGFEIESVKHDKFEYKFVDGTTMLNHYFIRLAFMESWKSIISSTKQSTIFKQIEKTINMQSDKKGMYKLSIPYVLIKCIKK
jgi:arsenite methyltransferase